ncbi:MAG: hypothetical protein OXI79_10165 [Gammaproteobacteria bacterium]|nr:hypothetical protein [Gammaproteobacteria bacterium]
MTVDKHFKRLVRARAARTGESYTAARWRLRRAAANPSKATTKRVKLADLGLSVAIPEAWHRVTHSMWGQSYPALHYEVTKDGSRLADLELNSQRLGSVRDPARAAAEAVERARSDPSARFEYTDTMLGGTPAIRLDPANNRQPQASERHYCLAHNDHLFILRFTTTDRRACDPVFDQMAASIELGDASDECLLGELSMTDYAPASIECVLIGALMAAQKGEDFSGRHLLAALVLGDSGIAASVLRTLDVTPERLGRQARVDDSGIAFLEIPVPAATFELLTQLMPGYALETVRTHHALLGILSPRNPAGGLELVEGLGVDAIQMRTALADRIAYENDASCVFCSFCRKPALDVAQMTPNRFSQICNECTAACAAMVHGRRPLPDNPMDRYTGGKRAGLFTACGYCGADEDLYTAPPQTRFICGVCAVRIDETTTRADGQ